MSSVVWCRSSTNHGFPQYFCGKRYKVGYNGAQWEIVGDLSQSNMLIGHYTHELDPKKRVTLPSKWRTDLGKKIVMTTGLDRALYIFPISRWETIAENLASLGFANADSRSFNRFMLANAYEVDIDASGRVLIPDALKTYASLQGPVVFAGMHSRVELWSEESWKQSLAKSEQEAEALASKLHEVGAL